MSSRSIKDLGRLWENAVCDFLRPHWPHVERRRLGGSRDRGDIAGLPGVMIEAKNARKIELGPWLDEAKVETANAGAEIGFVWFKRRGKTSAGDGYVLMDGATLVKLLKAAGW